jgi:hypothetical protein
MTKVYYGPDQDTSNLFRLSPAPVISISSEINYANDTMIGYTYTVNINGYATAMRLLNDKPENDEDKTKSLEQVVSHIEIVRKILNRNSSNLLVMDDEDNILIKCKGGTIRSLDFSDSENNWTTYAQYSAQIEFNEIELLNSDVNCASGFLDPKTLSPNLVDINKYKIKEFSDSWSFSAEDEMYNIVKNNDIGASLNIDNNSINVSYNISATGKNYYIGDNLVPAWVQAKNFVQDRLHKVITNLISGGTVSTSRVLRQTGPESCSASDTLNQIHRTNLPGILASVAGSYRIYNETITCETSEADGSFSANYSSLIKKNSNTSFTNNNVRHTVSKNISTNYDSNLRKSVSISIQGNIEGLFEGGLIKVPGSFNLPNNGSLLIGGTLANKFASAQSLLTKIIEGDDLKANYKTVLGITKEQLELNNQDCVPGNINPSSFNLTRNYMEGNISYSAEYTSNRACTPSGEIASASISVENPTPILAEFNIPSGFAGNGGVIIQDIGTKTNRKISVSVQGRSNPDCCIKDNIDNLLDLACDGIKIPKGIKLPDENLYILTQKTREDNIIDGSFSINLGYICSKGCNIN